MSFPTLQVRPNEKNPKVLRAHEFLRQSNQLVERNLVNAEGKKMLSRMLSKMVAEVKGIYALDEKRVEAGKSAKLMEKLKSTQHMAMAVMEDRFVLADLARQVQEKKFSVQRKLTDIDNLRNSVQIAKADVQREKEKMEKRRISVVKATEELQMRSTSILKHLENSEDVAKLRRMEEETRVLEEEVQILREEKKSLGLQIMTNRATLKAESKKSFQKTVIECAKHYKLCQSLTPKLIKSQKNVELLKEEEEMRRASGSLDDTIMFDRSFVHASMEQERPSNVHSSPQVTRPSLSNHPIFSKEIRKSPPPTPKVFEKPKPVPIQPKTVVEKPKIVEKPVEVQKEPQVEPMEVQEQEEEEEMEQQEEEDNHQNVTINISQLSENSQHSGEARGGNGSHEVSMETQRLLPPSEDVVEEEEAEIPEKDKSIDIMEQEEPMEVEETPGATASESNETTSSSSQNKKVGSSPKQQISAAVLAINSNSKDKAGDLLDDVAARLENPEDVGSGEGPTDNFSFNFFGNSNKEGNGEENGSGSDNNFDFNFGNIGSGDEASNNGSAFDFFGGGGGGNDEEAGNSNLDPFGFGKSTDDGNGGGNGDMSFNFNFDGDNGGDGEGPSPSGGSFFNF